MSDPGRASPAKRFCTSCGVERSGDSRFCAWCGTEFGIVAVPLPVRETAALAAPAGVARPFRQLRCVECASTIDAGLVCARCASKTTLGAAPASPATPPPDAAAPPRDPAHWAQKSTGSYARKVASNQATLVPSAMSLWSLAASVAFVAVCLTSAHASPLALVLVVAGVVLAALVALVAAAIWGRPKAQSCFSAVLCFAFGSLFFLRTFARPKLGLTYDDVQGYAQASYVEPDGPLGQLGWRAPMWIQSVDGVETGYGKAELRDVISSKRVLDRVRVVAWDGRTLAPVEFDATLFDE